MPAYSLERLQHELGWLPITKSASGSVQGEAGYLLLKEPTVVYRERLVAWPLKVPSALCELGGTGSQGVTRVEQAEFTRPMQI